MNITPHINHPIHNGFNRTNPQRDSSSDVQQKESSKQPATPPLTSQIVESQFNVSGAATGNQRMRPAINAQPMLDQNLTHRGSQAKDIYQEVEMSNEAELMPRLSVTA